MKEPTLKVAKYWHNRRGIVIQTSYMRQSRESAIACGEGALRSLQKTIKEAKIDWRAVGFVVVKAPHGWKTIMFGAKKPISI